MSLGFRYELHIFFVLERSFRKAFKDPNLKSKTKEEKNLLSRWGCQGALQIWERFGDGDLLRICGWGKDSARQDCSIVNLLGMGLVCVVWVGFFVLSTLIQLNLDRVLRITVLQKKFKKKRERDSLMSF